MREKKCLVAEESLRVLSDTPDFEPDAFKRNRTTLARPWGAKRFVFECWAMG